MHELHMKDTRRQQMDRSAARPAHEGHRFPGHEQRMADHIRRIRSTACECGSGKPYGECCIENDHQRSLAQVSCSLPRSVHPDVTTRCEVEDRLRIRAFGAFYKAGHQEHDLLVRFASALVASAGPVRDAPGVNRWRRRFCTRPSRELQEAGQ